MSDSPNTASKTDWFHHAANRFYPVSPNTRNHGFVANRVLVPGIASLRSGGMGTEKARQAFG